MATTRPSRATAPARTARPLRYAERREREARDSRIERRIYLAATAVGLAVLLIVAAGVILTVVLPPRAKVVTVGTRTFTASEVATRAKYAAVVESNASVASDPAAVIPRLVSEETLRQRAGHLGVSVSDEDLRAELRRRVGVTADRPDDEFRTAYDRFLDTIPVGRPDFEEFVRVAVLRTKVVDAFKASVGEKGPQVRLLAVASPDRAKLDEMRSAVLSGKDFKEEAVARGLVQQPAQADLAWYDPPSLPQGIAAVRDLKAGETSEVILDPGSGGYVLVQVAERSEDRPYDDTVKGQVANRQFAEWSKSEEAALAGEASLDGAAKSWVQRQVQGALDAARRRAEAQQRAAR